MNMRSQDLEEARKVLTGLGLVWYQVAEYRMTHGYLHVLITDAGFQRLAHVYLYDSDRLCGATSGGPLGLDVREELCDGETCVVFTIGDGAFVASGMRLVVELAEGVAD